MEGFVAAKPEQSALKKCVIFKDLKRMNCSSESVTNESATWCPTNGLHLGRANRILGLNSGGIFFQSIT